MILLYFLLILLLFINIKSKSLFYGSFCVLIVLFCFNTDNADRSIYEWRLEQYDQVVGITEPGYYCLMWLFSSLKLNIQFQYIIVGVIYLSSLFLIIRKMTKNTNIVLAWYMLAIFLLDVTQLRATTALIFVIWGFYFLYSQEKRSKSILLFCSMILLASFFHSSSLAYGIFVLSKLKNKKRLLYIIGGVFTILLCFKYFIISYFSEIFDVTNKVQQISESTAYKGNNANLITILLLIFLQFLYFMLKRSYGISDAYTKLSTNICLISVLIIPLVSFSADFRRIYYFVSIFLVINIVRWITKKNKIVVISSLASLSGLYFYRIIYIGNFDTVLIPLLTKNLIFEL